ncbi:MAG: sigma-70 family RNA polymerase sigma factor [Planctomycetota bacterium]
MKGSYEMKDDLACSFPTTSWNQIERLGTNEFADAMAQLCQRYWFPVYVFIRRRCDDIHRAEDLTQSFFAKVCEQQTLRQADPTKGRFRSFLLASVRNFVSNELVSDKAIRRGGAIQVVSIDRVAAEQLYLRHQSTDFGADREFDRAWVLALMEGAIASLREEYRARGQEGRFECFVPLLRSVSLDYSQIAMQLGVSESNARQAASRFRRRYAELLRKETAATLANSDELEEEIDWMMRVFTDRRC